MATIDRPMSRVCQSPATTARTIQSDDTDERVGQETVDDAMV